MFDLISDKEDWIFFKLAHIHMYSTLCKDALGPVFTYDTKHFLNPTRFYMLFIDIRVTLVVNIITLRPLYMYNIVFYIFFVLFFYCNS